MAKKSKIARNEQRKVIVNRYAAKRLELKKALVSPTSTDEEREARIAEFMREAFAVAMVEEEKIQTPRAGMSLRDGNQSG